MLRNLLVVWTRDLRRLIGDKLYGSVPFSCVECCLDGLREDASLDVVLDGEVKLLLADKPIAPLLLELNHMGLEGSPGKIYRLPEGVALDEALQGTKSLLSGKKKR